LIEELFSDNVLSNLRNNYGVKEISFDSEKPIPEIKGKFLQIIDPNFSSKMSVIKEIL